MMPAPEGHFRTGLLAGQYTDDTEETLILAESMIRLRASQANGLRTSSWGGEAPGYWTSG